MRKSLEIDDKSVWDTERVSLYNRIERLENENEELTKKIQYLELLLRR